MNDDIITEVHADRRGATLVINGEETLWLSRELYMERELAQGEAFDYDELKKWLLPRQYPETLNAAVAFLAVRARSVLEVRQKLEQRHYLDEAVEMALYKLEKENLLNDEAFARDWATACARKHMGKRRILSELWRKGIDSDLAQQIVDGLDTEESGEAAVEQAQKLLRRYADESDPRKAAGKLMAAMARRGYAYDEANEAVREAMRRAREDASDD